MWKNEFDTIMICKEDINIPDSQQLINELSNVLSEITGDSGKGSFDPSDILNIRSLFVVARNRLGEAVGCGAFRPISNNIAEIKRMYAKYKNKGIGAKILHYLEEQAKEFGYTKIWLETRKVNEAAVNFYSKNGYQQIKNYGKYINHSKVICFEKELINS